MIILYGITITVIYLICFFYLYILVMGIYRAYLADKLKPFILMICLPAVLIGIIVDVFANIFIATIVFRSLPRQWLVTTRLIQIKNNPLEHHHNKFLAQYVCEHMLDIFDPSGRHCDDLSKSTK